MGVSTRILGINHDNKGFDVQAVVNDRQERIIESEKQIAVAKAKAEQLDIRAKTMEREARAACEHAQELRRLIVKGEEELKTVKAAPASEWKAAEQKLRGACNDLHKYLGELPDRVRNVLDN